MNGNPAAAALGLLLAAWAPVPLAAQFDPAAGLWGKAEPEHLRVMTWNIRDRLCRNNAKQDAPYDDWAAATRIVAALRPDVLILQECGDNSGNGSPGGLDTVAQLQATAGLFLRGGHDPFLDQEVTAWVGRWAPGFDLPFVHVGHLSDGFNRNVILSRFPFADLNGDGRSNYGDMPAVQPHLYAAGGGGGLRGFQIAEIDLPDALYAGNLVVGNSHLRSGTSAFALEERRKAARNIAYLIDHWYNGAGFGLPDPHDTIADEPPATVTLGPHDLVVVGGDYNEHELFADDGDEVDPGPARWVARAESSTARDGPDRDRSDMTRDAAVDPVTGQSDTWFGAKLDTLIWQDSVATAVREVVFHSGNLPATALPAELLGFLPNAQMASTLASDHRPVFVDFVLAAAGCQVAADLGGGLAGTGGGAPIATLCPIEPDGSGEAALVAQLDGARPGAAAVLVLGPTPAAQPFAGGILLPAPRLVLSGLWTDARGTLRLRAAAPPAGTPPLYLQWIVLDRQAPAGRALSNALHLPATR